MLSFVKHPLGLLALTQLLGSLDGAFANPSNGNAQGTQKPNFIFILTDDQDLHLNSIDYQPSLQKHFKEAGTFFSKHFATIAVCCPSRVSLLTGKAAHNTNVTDVSAPYGGYSKFISEGLNDKYLPVWLQDAGYNTYYTGKLMNGFSVKTYNNPYPKGWTGTDFLVDPGTYIYYNSTTQRNQDPPKQNPGVYSTDIVASDSVGFLDEALAAGKPFFLGVAPICPHGETVITAEGPAFYPPVPADRHKGLFPDLKIPRTPNFNPDVPSGGGWIKTLEKQNETVVEYNDDFHRKRVQSLQAVDELIDDIIGWLDEHPAILENTYLIYTTDNGYHIGQHRLAPGKTCGIEADINIPFFVRGPGVEKGKEVDFPTTHTDIAPTLFELAGIPLRDDFDGEPIPVTADQISAKKEKSEHVNVEFWGTGLLEGIYPGNGSGLIPEPGQATGGLAGANNTYKTVRIVGDSYSFSYTVWCTNEHELYDMTTDPYQMNNIFGSTSPVTTSSMEKIARNDEPASATQWDISKLTARLDALLLTLKACKGKVCTRPWESLHPKGNVRTLRDAMNPQFDDFYIKQQPKVSFTACKLGYLADFEGPLESIPYTDEQGRVGRLARWDDWV